MGEEAANKKKTPSDFLKRIIGRPVCVKLYTGEKYNGILACLDGFLNIVLEQCEEIIDGTVSEKYGDCFLRGNNVLYVTLQ